MDATKSRKSQCRQPREGPAAARSGEAELRQSDPVESGAKIRSRPGTSIPLDGDLFRVYAV